MTRMNPEVKAKWVAALRSNKYKQGTGNLCETKQIRCVANDPEEGYSHIYEEDVDPTRGGTTFCCLGVLGHVMGVLGGYMDGEEYLNVQDAGEFGIVEVQGDLADMNDNGMTFEQIASYIEREL